MTSAAGRNVVSAEQRLEEERAHKDKRLKPFRDGKGKPRKMEPDDRDRLMEKQFPSARNLDWGTALSNDDDLFVRIMRDIIKLEQRTPGRSGPRPNTLDYEAGLQTFRTLMGQDFSTLPFIEIFPILARDLSRTQIARKCHISRTKVTRLLSGEYEPDLVDLRAIADGFRKHPSFFIEYRKQFIIDTLAEKLLGEPESTIAFYQKILKVN